MTLVENVALESVHRGLSFPSSSLYRTNERYGSRDEDNSFLPPVTVERGGVAATIRTRKKSRKFARTVP